jgi:hypothetical protein
MAPDTNDVLLEQPTEVSGTIANGGTARDGTKQIFGRWSFQYPRAREWVEERLHGRVLNACAGKTHLSHDGEIVRNDMNPERDADLHVDVADIASHFDAASFDCVVFDPPFDDFQAEDKYGNMRADNVFAAFRAFNELLRTNGTVITFGWNSWGMGSFSTFDREETVLFQRGACLRDVIATVDRRTTATLTYGGFK